MIPRGFGRLNRYVELHSVSTSKSAYGEDTETWAKYANAWASIQPLSGSEFLQAQQVSGKRQFRIVIRYNGTVTESHRVIYGTRTFEINAVLNIGERDEYLELMCTEVV